MLQTNKRRVFLLAIGLIAAMLIGMVFILHPLKQYMTTRRNMAKDTLGRISLLIIEFDRLAGYPVERNVEIQGELRSWRVLLNAFDQHTQGPRYPPPPFLIDAVDPELLQPASCPSIFRIPIDSSPPQYTSVFAVYDESALIDAEGYRLPWIIVAAANTGIVWSSTKDMTVSEFARFLSERKPDEFPIFFKDRAERTGRFTSDKHFTYSMDYYSHSTEELVREIGTYCD